MALGLCLSVTGRVKADHVFTTYDVPDATSTNHEGAGINTSGQIVGEYVIGGITHGYLLSGGGYTPIDVPGSTLTSAQGINDSGQIVGPYVYAGGATHSLLLIRGRYTLLRHLP